jgi:thiamine biosynthesis protein ThiS
MAAQHDLRTVRIRVNGEELEFDREPTIHDVLARLDAPRAAVAVEVNGTIVPRASHDRVLGDGDHVEVVTFVGGG